MITSTPTFKGTFLANIIFVVGCFVYFGVGQIEQINLSKIGGLIVESKYDSVSNKYFFNLNTLNKTFTIYAKDNEEVIVVNGVYVELYYSESTTEEIEVRKVMKDGVVVFSEYENRNPFLILLATFQTLVTIFLYLLYKKGKIPYS